MNLDRRRCENVQDFQNVLNSKTHQLKWKVQLSARWVTVTDVKT